MHRLFALALSLALLAVHVRCSAGPCFAVNRSTVFDFRNYSGIILEFGPTASAREGALLTTQFLYRLYFCDRVEMLIANLSTSAPLGWDFGFLSVFNVSNRTSATTTTTIAGTTANIFRSQPKRDTAVDGARSSPLAPTPPSFTQIYTNGDQGPPCESPRNTSIVVRCGNQCACSPTAPCIADATHPAPCSLVMTVCMPECPKPTSVFFPGFNVFRLGAGGTRELWVQDSRPTQLSSLRQLSADAPLSLHLESANRALSVAVKTSVQAVANSNVACYPFDFRFTGPAVASSPLLLTAQPVALSVDGSSSCTRGAAVCMVSVSMIVMPPYENVTLTWLSSCVSTSSSLWMFPTLALSALALFFLIEMWSNWRSGVRGLKLLPCYRWCCCCLWKTPQQRGYVRTACSDTELVEPAIPAQLQYGSLSQE